MLGESIPRKETFAKSGDAQVYDLVLLGVIVDLMSACTLINSNQNCLKLEPYAYQEILISIGYRLLHRYPLTGNKPDNDNENAWRLGILAFLTTVLFQHGRSQTISYGILSRNLRRAIEDTSSNEIKESTFLWLLFIGGVSIFDVTDKWLLCRIKKCLSTLRIDSWQSAREAVRNLPWIDAFHDKRGQDIWQALVWE
jgi:hypothetical protein